MLNIFQQPQCELAGEQHILEDYYSSRAVRSLVLLSRQPGPAGETACRFVAGLWAGALKGRCTLWVGTHGAKVSFCQKGSGQGQIISSSMSDGAQLGLHVLQI